MVHSLVNHELEYHMLWLVAVQLIDDHSRFVKPGVSFVNSIGDGGIAEAIGPGCAMLCSRCTFPSYVYVSVCHINCLQLHGFISTPS